MTIREIESLKRNDLEEMRASGSAELLNIKGHDCYFVNLGEYFAYSVLVFKNNHHIYFANDYQLHNSSIATAEELKNHYIDSLNNKLFTESELMQDVKTYDEHERKSYYVRNLWIMQFEYVSMFGIGAELDEIKNKAKNMIFCPTCFCYVNDTEIVKNANKFIDRIENSFSESKKNLSVFTEMVSTELANHEAGYTGDYTDGLAALGLNYEDLTSDQKTIVKQELKKQMDYDF